jgi:predicted NAD/FAD-dependent oxidoreductase
MPNKFAVIGAGMSGLACATRLLALGHEVRVFEKSRGVSGRMSTRRSEMWECDHGAQYFTATDPAFKKAVAEWVAAGAAAPWAPRIKTIGMRPSTIAEPSGLPATERFVGMPRMTSPGQWMARNLEVRLNQRVASLTRANSGWQLMDVENNVIGDGFDAVILAIPAPQIAPILIHHQPVWINQAQAIKMLPCWALMAQIDDSQSTDFDAAFINEGPLSWIANNASKPGRGKAAVWSIHASPEWTQNHLLATPEEISPILVQAFEGHTGLKATGVTAHRWLYSLPQTKANLGCLWDPELKLAACGDWLVGGKVQGAWQSGIACAERITA